MEMRASVEIESQVQIHQVVMDKEEQVQQKHSMMDIFAFILIKLLVLNAIMRTFILLMNQVKEIKH